MSKWQQSELDIIRYSKTADAETRANLSCVAAAGAVQFSRVSCTRAPSLNVNIYQLRTYNAFARLSRTVKRVTVASIFRARVTRFDFVPTFRILFDKSRQDREIESRGRFVETKENFRAVRNFNAIMACDRFDDRWHCV